MLTIRFARVGKRNKAQFKIVLQEKIIAPGGRHVEILGSYDPHSKLAILKEDRIKYWLSQGAQASDTAWNLLVSKGIISDKKRAVKIPAKKVEENTEVKEAPKTEEIKAEEKPTEEVKTEEVKAEPEPAKEEKTEEVKTEEKPAKEVKTEEIEKEKIEEEKKPEESKKEEKSEVEAKSEEVRDEEKKEEVKKEEKPVKEEKAE